MGKRHVGNRFDCVVVKLGGAAITRKGELETLDHEVLGAVVEHIRLVKEDQGGKLRLVVVHGAGSFGHFQAKEYGVQGGSLDDERTIRGFAETRVSVTKLNHAVVSALTEAGIPAVGISPCGFWDEEASPKSIEILKHLLASGFVPVVHGDAIIQGDRTVILSGDRIVNYLSVEALRPRFVLFLSDVDGIFDRPPASDGAQLIREIEVEASGRFEQKVEFASGHDHDTTGGMAAKVEDGVFIAKHGIDVLIARAGSTAALCALQRTFPACLSDDKWRGTRISLKG